ncbi:MAG: choice-of-anchor J domain-containing protein, partial [Chitinophagales bacterium]|nr:choice-of-anchor J domain-containing protein [Chitinophagales bacterium]
SEGFNAASLPACWTAYEGAPGASYHWQPVTSDASYGAGSPAEGSHFLRMYYYLASTTYNPYYLKSIPFDLGATAKRAKFAIWMGINSGANNLKFEVSADGGLTWTTLSTYSANPANNNSSAPWENKTVDLSAYTNQTVIFRLNAISSYGSGYTDIGFDNFVVENIPACAEPTALSAGSITTSSASISFIGAGTAYILEYGAPGFTPGTDNNAGVGGTIVTGSASPIAISGLTSNTTYDVYVRQDCTGDGNG